MSECDRPRRKCCDQTASQSIFPIVFRLEENKLDVSWDNEGLIQSKQTSFPDAKSLNCEHYSAFPSRSELTSSWNENVKSDFTRTSYDQNLNANPFRPKSGITKDDQESHQQSAAARRKKHNRQIGREMQTDTRNFDILARQQENSSHLVDKLLAEYFCEMDSTPSTIVSDSVETGSQDSGFDIIG